MSRPDATPRIIRRRMGLFNIEATPFGDGRVCFVVDGPPAAIRDLAAALRSANFYVETYADDPRTLYGDGRAPVEFFIDVDFEAVTPTVSYPSAVSESLHQTMAGAT